MKRHRHWVQIYRIKTNQRQTEIYINRANLHKQNRILSAAQTARRKDFELESIKNEKMITNIVDGLDLNDS